jgi:hypothetical protein
MAQVHPPDGQLCYVGSANETAPGGERSCHPNRLGGVPVSGFAASTGAYAPPIIVDGRNLFTPREIGGEGLRTIAWGGATSSHRRAICGE